MKKKMLTARVMCAVMAATLALSPSITVMGASAESLYGITADGDAAVDEEEAPEAGEDEDETESEENPDVAGSDDASTGAQTDEQAADESADPESEEDEDAAEDAVEEDATESDIDDEEASEAEDEDATLASDEVVEEVSEKNGLVGTALAPFPKSAVPEGEPVEMGVNVLGQIYTWTESGDQNHVGLYIYSENGAGTTAGYTVSSQLPAYKTTLTDVAFDENIVTIGDSVFFGCSALSKVSFPENITTLGYCAFRNCTSLTEITIPNTVTTVRDNKVFNGCTNLTTVRFEEGMKKIPDNMLNCATGGGIQGAGNVVTVYIPSSVTEIGEKAFVDQTSLKNVYIDGAEIEKIGKYAFSNCASLKTIDLPDTITLIDTGAFEFCSLLTDLILPDSLTTLGYCAFRDCTSLTEITIPNTVTTVIDNKVFNGCTKLTTVTFEDGMTKIPDNMLNCATGGGIQGAGNVVTVYIPSSVTEIGEKAFLDQTSLKNVYIDGAEIEKIGKYAFADCASLKTIDLPDTITLIDTGAFEFCSLLTDLVLPDSLTTLGYCAFRDCTSLTEITIPNKVTTVKDNKVFNGCTKLTTVIFEEGMTRIPNNMLDCATGGGIHGAGYVATVIIPSSVVEIGEAAFRNQPSLKSITLPASLKTVGKYAFSDDAQLKTVYYKGNSSTKSKIVIGNGNDYLNEAEWVYVKSASGVSLDHTSALFYVENLTTEESRKFTLNATVTPAEANIKDVTVSFENTEGNAIASVTAGAMADGVTPIKGVLSGEKGKAVITVRSKDGGFTATCNIVVKEKETARTPVFYLNGKRVNGEVTMTDDDRLTIGGVTTGSQSFWGTNEAGIRGEVKYNKDTERYYTTSEQVDEFTDALVGGYQIHDSKTIYVVSYKKDYKPGAAASITIKYEAASAWGEIAEEDRAQFAGDSTKVPEGVWIPERFLTDETLVYTGSKVVLKNFNVYYGKELLAEKTDYSVSYKNNINAADKSAETKPTVIITLKGNYAKTTTDIGFTINKQVISDESASITVVTTAESRDKTGNLKTMTPDPKLKVAGRALKLGTDYEISYYRIGEDRIFFNISEEGVYDIMVKGIGNYAGTAAFDCAVQVTGANSIKISALTLSKAANKQIPLDWNGNDQSIFAQNITAKYKTSDVPAIAYDVVIPKITKAGKYTATVVGSGMPFTIDGKDCYVVGSKNLTFTVSGSAAIKSAQITMPTTQVTYSPEGNRITDYSLKYADKELVEGKDFSVTFKNDAKAGTATITYTGLGAFTGSVNKTYKINKANISDAKALDATMAEWNDATESYCYTKGGTKPVVTLEGIPATAYSVSYSNNKAKAAYAAGAKKNPSIKLTGKGNYTGTKIVYFSITESNIADLDMTVNDILVSASPKKYAQTPVILDSNGSKLAAGTDFNKVYEYTYACDSIVVQKTGSGKKAVSKTVFKAAGDKVEDIDIIPAGAMIKMTVTGKGNYTGSISEVYTIAGAKISDLKFAIQYDAGKSGFAYTGKEIRPGKSRISVKTKAGIDVVDSGDYYDIVSYKNNVNKGTATITIKGKNGYVGTANVTFKIVAR